jgi:hypothetical protein
MTDFDSARAIQLYHEYGDLSFNTWARVCLDHGVFSEAFKAQAAFRRACSTLKQFAREEDAETGLPRLGQTTKTDEAGDPIIRQPELWDRDDALLHIRVRLENRNAQHLRLIKIVEWFEDRFGGPCPYRAQIARLPDCDYDDTA